MNELVTERRHMDAIVQERQSPAVLTGGESLRQSTWGLVSLPVMQGGGARCVESGWALPFDLALTRYQHRVACSAKLRKFKIKAHPHSHPKWPCIQVHSSGDRTPGKLG